MSLDPFYEPQAPGLMGFACFMLKRYADGLPHLRECVSRAPNLRLIRLWLAATYARLGDKAKARQRLSKCCGSILPTPSTERPGCSSPSSVPRTPGTSSAVCDKLVSQISKYCPNFDGPVETNGFASAAATSSPCLTVGGSTKDRTNCTPIARKHAMAVPGPQRKFATGGELWLWS